MVRHQVPIRPPTRVYQDEQVHPSECRSFPYSHDMRQMAVTMRLNGLDEPNAGGVVAFLRHEGRYPVERTVDRWMETQIANGHSRPFRTTGNRRATREIRGRNLILLSLYRAAFPKASIAEVNAFLFVMNQDHDPINRLHSYSQICRAEASILITKKRSSTTAFEAFTASNIIRRKNFWSMPYPFGCVGISANDMIDLDEAGIYPNETNRKYGKSWNTFKRSRALY